jgi:hypothetical protein
MKNIKGLYQNVYKMMERIGWYLMDGLVGSMGM